MHRDNPEQGRLEIVVPVNGTEMARRGAEVAIAIARMVHASLRVIYVSETSGKGRANRRGIVRARWHEQAVLKDIVALADAAEQRITTAIRTARAPDDAILAEAGRDPAALIVMGVARPAGDPLFFGEIAAAVLEKATISVLLVAS